MIHVSIVPLVTPFRNGSLDETCLAALVEWQIASGSHGISVTGTTGEPSSLSRDERKRVFEIVSEATNKRIPFVPATGSNNLEEIWNFPDTPKNSAATARGYEISVRNGFLTAQEGEVCIATMDACPMAM